MQKIRTHLWFDKEAQEAAEFYTSIFPNSKINSSIILYDTPSGDALSLTFEINGYEFMAINGGPFFKINPSVSFFVNFDPSKDPSAKENLDSTWEKLSEGATILMPLQQYPFSERYGWLQDKYGVSWQIMLTAPEGEERPFIIPSLLFVNEVCGKAEEAVNFYLSVFKNSKIGTISRYPAGMEPNKEGTLNFGEFNAEGHWFAVMDSALEHNFKFNEAVSFVVNCEDQDEIDYYWEKLSADPEAEQCGWLKDKYGVSWQITPSQMDEMFQNGSTEQINRVTQAFLKMKKFNIEELKKAYEGKDLV